MSSNKEIVSRFFAAFVAGDAATAGSFLDLGVEFVRNDRVIVRGTQALDEFIETPRPGEEREQGKRKLQEADGVFYVHTTYRITLPDDDYGPSKSREAYLGLTVRGEKIVRVELLEY
jgi:ketosteroid isomerase-like protein